MGVGSNAGEETRVVVGAGIRGSLGGDVQSIGYNPSLMLHLKGI